MPGKVTMIREPKMGIIQRAKAVKNEAEYADVQARADKLHDAHPRTIRRVERILKSKADILFNTKVACQKS